jgi:glycosyltransferase involved in cell wall biosynthesis
MQLNNLLKMKICALIPAFNEEKTISSIIDQTKRYIDNVIVVDNGSTDNTAAIAEKCGVKVIKYSAEQGYGAAQYIGQQYAISEGFDYILQLDADGQHNPEYIPELIKTMQEGDYDIVLGSRFLCNSHENLSFVRWIGISFFSSAVSLLGRTKVTDVTSGFKIYKTSSLIKLSKPDSLHPAVEQMLEIAKKNMSIKEIPVEMPIRYAGESHLSVIKFAFYPFRAIWLLIKVSLLK